MKLAVMRPTAFLCHMCHMFQEQAGYYTAHDAGGDAKDNEYGQQVSDGGSGEYPYGDDYLGDVVCDAACCTDSYQGKSVNALQKGHDPKACHPTRHTEEKALKVAEQERCQDDSDHIYKKCVFCTIHIKNREDGDICKAQAHPGNGKGDGQQAFYI